MIMVTENTRLNIERARAALAKARMEGQSGAIRSPRPVDLSRLAELEERRSRLEARSAEFRGAVRQRLGLAEAGAERLSVSSVLGTAAMEGAMCDADVCAPPAPRLPGKSPALAGKPAPAVSPARKAGAGKVRVRIRKKRFLGLF
ncbi:hypothetical protein E5163_01245 [Marinicauda algicola]|uniref:Uncharacterized protein n=2 Tax=Marinicauda algicola TaxID=2029849 RepID=A0A4S2H2H6_9PROT|nr:hypothetical protein [Marinicauda algicola]TGY89795.1 hypothetical protein E5163_01245 [Marinicauda algicola]